jgi:hypothetical protein
MNASYLVSFQNRQWIYVLLQNTWSTNMKITMQRYQELHEEDGVLFYLLYLQHFTGTSTDNLIEANSQLQDSKLKLSLYQSNALNFTNAIWTPVRCLIKAREPPTIQHSYPFYKVVLKLQKKNFEILSSTFILTFATMVLPSPYPCFNSWINLILSTNKLPTLAPRLKKRSPSTGSHCDYFVVTIPTFSFE